MQNQDSTEKVSRYLGNNVKVNLGGPESLPGRLLDIKSDYLTLDTKKDGVVYYPLRHVKSVSIDSEDFSRSSGSMAYHHESDFHSVIRRLHHKKVKINRGGPESVEGVVSNVFDNHLELTVNNNIIFVSIYHIKSISQIGKSDNDSGNKRSQGNKKSGNRSSGNNRSSNRNKNRSSNRNRTSGSGNRTSGNRSTSGRSSRNRGNRNTSGAMMSSRNDPRTSRVFEALAAAQQEGTDGFMFNDPTGSTGSSRRTSRSCRSRTSGRNRSSRGHSSRGNRSSHRNRSSRGNSSRGTRSSGRNRSSRGNDSRRSHHSRRNRSSRGRNRSSRHQRSNRGRRSSGDNMTWNGMSVRRGGWVKLN